MRTVQFGQTNMRVSAVALGCMSLSYDRLEESKTTVRTAYEMGINFFDTADIYGRGDSEKILGAALAEAGIAREEVIIASKCSIVLPGMEPAYAYKAYDLSAGYIKASCEASLKRLGMDYLDVYQPHRIDYLTHPHETAEALEELKAEGKIRHVGVSNYTADEIRTLGAFTRLESLQTEYSLLHLEPLEAGLAAVTQEKQMAILPWSPLGKGILTGKRAVAHDSWQQQRDAGLVAQLLPFAEAYDIVLGQLALAWLMQQPGPVIPLVGTANPDHVTEAAEAVGVTLDRDDWYEILVIARGRPMPWGQKPYVYTKER